ncbi:hypothetical protein [Motilimonas cestriensis]|uniref:hypothetical protein n=1 Tax=Motilimonas cestriensis TaxID=2742685 RepID=UPI003DA6AF09
MQDLLYHVNQWHWLAFSLFMLLMELCRLKGWSFVVGGSAFIVGLLMHFEPITWPFQWALMLIALLILAFIRAIVLQIKSQ